jgi:hypothetical protein
MLLLSTCNGFFGMHVSKKVTAPPEGMADLYDRMYQRLLNGLLT